jgi:hypothetical protein
MRRRFPSDSYGNEKKRRLRRIQNRAHPALIDAYEHGDLSLRQFDLLSKLPPAKQRRLIAAEKARSASALLAAQAVNQFLDSLSTGTPIRLSEVAAAIRAPFGLRA